MKRLFVATISLLVSGLLFSGTCNQLGITIRNNTGHACKLQSVNYYYGSPVLGAPSLLIENGAVSPTFFVEQNGSDGINVGLNYQCDNKKIEIESVQSYCGLSAGSVKGFSNMANQFSSTYQVVLGSYWYGRPGQISWLFGDAS